MRRTLLTAVAVTFAIAPLAARAATAADVEHVTVFANPGEFAGWPANEGFWTWGDEVLVGFEVSKFVETDNNHSVDRNSPKRIAFARSLDGGRTWKTEEHPEIAPPAYLEDPEKFKQVSPGVKEPVPCPGGIDFTHPDFAMKVRAETFYTSTDRGRSWAGPYRLPDLGKQRIMARTNYLVFDKNTCRIFAEFVDKGTVVPEGGERGLTLMAETTDGGKTWAAVSTIGPDPYDREKAKIAYSIMPGLTTLDDGTILAAMRQRSDKQKWVDLYASGDAGRSWTLRSVAFDKNNNPGALVRLGGDRLAILYGYRNPPYGLRAKLSEDAGKTWGAEIVLRDDARKWDLGYTRAYRRPDGKVLVVYYYNTAERPEMFIAGTIWQPPAAGANAQAAAKP